MDLNTNPSKSRSNTLIGHKVENTVCVVDNDDIRYLCQVISGPDQSQTETLPALHHLRSTGKQLDRG